jgi:hypothetical protein
MMLIHNQSFSIQIHGHGTDNPMSPPAGGATGAMEPPSYEEAMSAVSDGKGGTIVYMKNGNVISIPPGVSFVFLFLENVHGNS